MKEKQTKKHIYHNCFCCMVFFRCAERAAKRNTLNVVCETQSKTTSEKTKTEKNMQYANSNYVFSSPGRGRAKQEKRENEKCMCRIETVPHTISQCVIYAIETTVVCVSSFSLHFTMDCYLCERRKITRAVMLCACVCVSTSQRRITDKQIQNRKNRTYTGNVSTRSIEEI